MTGHPLYLKTRTIPGSLTVAPVSSVCDVCLRMLQAAAKELQKY